MSNTTTRNAARLTALETSVSGIRSDLAEIRALLDPTAPAREPLTVTLARQEQARDERVAKARKTRKTRKPASKGSVVKAKMTVTQQGRKSWNATFSASVRLSGLRFGYDQVSLYRISQNRWARVVAMRDAGATPAEAFDALVADARQGVIH